MPGFLAWTKMVRGRTSNVWDLNTLSWSMASTKRVLCPMVGGGGEGSADPFILPRPCCHSNVDSMILVSIPRGPISPSKSCSLNIEKVFLTLQSCFCFRSPHSEYHPQWVNPAQTSANQPWALLSAYSPHWITSGESGPSSACSQPLSPCSCSL